MPGKTGTAKKFKEFDQRFKQYQGKILPEERIDFDHKAASEFSEWPLMREFYDNKFSHEEVSRAVYGTPSSINWQMFRVSLKGQSTNYKLYRLHKRYIRKVAEHVVTANNVENELEMIRIFNYIGALRRNNAIDPAGKVIK